MESTPGGLFQHLKSIFHNPLTGVVGLIFAGEIAIIIERLVSFDLA